MLTYLLTLPHTLRAGGGALRSALPVQVGGRTRVLSVVAAAAAPAAGGSAELALEQLELALHGSAVPPVVAGGGAQPQLGAFEWGWTRVCERTPASGRAAAAAAAADSELELPAPSARFRCGEPDGRGAVRVVVRAYPAAEDPERG